MQQQSDAKTHDVAIIHISDNGWLREVPRASFADI